MIKNMQKGRDAGKIEAEPKPGQILFSLDAPEMRELVTTCLDVIPHEKVTATLLFEAFDKFLQTLPLNQRTAFLQRNIHQIQFKEIADKLNKSEGAVRIAELRAGRAICENFCPVC